LKGIFSLWY